MVPLSEKRHRIYESEIPAVKEALRLLLLNLYETREDRTKAEAACRVLFRLDKKDPGRPKYPEFDWGSIPYYAEYFGSSED
jgi:hypothetical protein